MGSKEDAFMAKLLATFKVEAEEHLKNLNQGLLALEKAGLQNPPQELLQTVFREAHSLKGAARSVNHDVIQLLCQSVESIFAALKQNQIELSPLIFDTLYESLDLIAKLLEAPSKADSKMLLAEMMQKLDALLDKSPTTEIPPRESVSKNAAKTDNTAAKQPDSQIDTPSGCLPDLKPAAQVFQKNEIPPLSKQPIAHAHAQNMTEPEGKNVEKQAPPSEETTAATEAHAIKSESISSKDASSSATKTVRVSLNKLDRLFQQTEELLTFKLAAKQQLSGLKQMEKSLKEWKKESMHLQKEIEEQWVQENEQKSKSLHFLEQHQKFINTYLDILFPLIKSTSLDSRLLAGMIDSLLDETKKLLMQPFSTLVETFPRMLRDLSQQLGKKVSLDIQGSDIEIDRRILEEIKDPLIHLIRNSVDHGIEIPAVRQKKGKEDCGNIKIIASQLSGNSVEIIVADDGGGISFEALKQSALKQKFLSPKELETLSDEDSLKLIFHSGISTSKIVTDLSGRGLGMGIVAEKVDKLGGHLSVESTPAGTSIRIVLPLTLATFRGIHLKVSECDFIMPTHNVKRVIKIHKNEIKSVENRSMISIDGYAHSYVHLRDVLGLPTLSNEAENHYITIIIVKAAKQAIALGVDMILSEQEVLVKRFGKQLTRVKNILSATVMEMGKVIPILNPSDLVRSIVIENFQIAKPQNSESEAEDNRIKKILLAEDSLTTRMLLKNILEASGYDVIAAVDGEEAFRLLKENPVDLLLTDIEMPNMDGFTLTENVRKSATLSNLPVVLCTSLCSAADRERGIEVGAQAYLDKSSFTQSHLLDVIKKLL